MKKSKILFYSVLFSCCLSFPLFFEGCSGDGDGHQPGGTTAPGDDAVYPFSFLNEPGPVSEPMKALWLNFFASPDSPEEAAEIMRNNREAAQRIMENYEEAQNRLLEALDTLTLKEHHGYFSLTPLLEMIGDSDGILSHLYSRVVEELSPNELLETQDPTAEELTRHTCLGLLFDHARKGSGPAKERVLQSVTSPSINTRSEAVRFNYQLIRDRRLARRELLKRIDPESTYLLYLH